MESDPTLEKNKRYSAIAMKYTDAIINTALKEKQPNKVASSRGSGNGIFSEEVVRRYAAREQNEQVGIER